MGRSLAPHFAGGLKLCDDALHLGLSARHSLSDLGDALGPNLAGQVSREREGERARWSDVTGHPGGASGGREEGEEATERVLCAVSLGDEICRLARSNLDFVERLFQKGCVRALRHLAASK